MHTIASPVVEHLGVGLMTPVESPRAKVTSFLPPTILGMPAYPLRSPLHGPKVAATVPSVDSSHSHVQRQKGGVFVSFIKEECFPQSFLQLPLYFTGQNWVTGPSHQQGG